MLNRENTADYPIRVFVAIIVTTIVVRTFLPPNVNLWVVIGVAFAIAVCTFILAGLFTRRFSNRRHLTAQKWIRVILGIGAIMIAVTNLWLYLDRRTPLYLASTFFMTGVGLFMLERASTRKLFGVINAALGAASIFLLFVFTDWWLCGAIAGNLLVAGSMLWRSEAGNY
jgi:hypothetical protein